MPLHHLFVYQISRQSNNLFPLFMVTFTPLQKKKNEETKPIFESLYLGNTWRDLLEIWNVGYWRWRASPQQKISWFHTSSMKLNIHNSCAIILPVNILMGVACWLLGPHNTLPCVLINDAYYYSWRQTTFKFIAFFYRKDLILQARNDQWWYGIQYMKRQPYNKFLSYICHLNYSVYFS